MLEELDWLVGDWVLDVDEKALGEGDGRHDLPPATRMSVRWDEGRAFLVRDVRVPLAANDATAGFIDVHPRIGWDSGVRRLRSGGFSSDGGRSEATRGSRCRRCSSLTAVRSRRPTSTVPTGRTGACGGSCPMFSTPTPAGRPGRSGCVR